MTTPIARCQVKWLFVSIPLAPGDRGMPPNNPLQEAWKLFQRAYEHQMKGNLDLAEEYYKRSIELFPTAEAYTFLGWTYSFRREYQAAIEQCRKAILIDPEFGNPYNDIGAYLIELGRCDEAIPWLQQALQARRYESYHYPYFNLGRVFLVQEMYNRALECFEKSLEIAPDYTLAQQAIEQLRKKVN